MRVLLVEDDDRQRMLLAVAIRASGVATVIEAADGLTALRLLEKDPPDLVMTDYQMSKMDGISFVRQMRSNGNDIPVIMLSGQRDPKVMDVAETVGVNAYLQKPVSWDVLFAKIRELTQSRVV